MPSMGADMRALHDRNRTGHSGELAEWFMAAVLKIAGQRCPVGSNPTLPARIKEKVGRESNRL